MQKIDNDICLKKTNKNQKNIKKTQKNTNIKVCLKKRAKKEKST